MKKKYKMKFKNLIKINQIYEKLNIAKQWRKRTSIIMMKREKTNKIKNKLENKNNEDRGSLW